MSGTNEDDEIFEIADYTCISPWEHLTLRIETLITEWNINHTGATDKHVTPLPKSVTELDTSWHWMVQRASITFSSLNFTLTHYTLEPVADPDQGDSSLSATHPGLSNTHLPTGICQSLNAVLDLPTNAGESSPLANQLALWYGVTQMLVLTPDTATDVLYSEQQWTLIMAAFTMALVNTECGIAALVQQHDGRRQHWTGVCTNAGVRAELSSVHLKASTVTNRINTLAHCTDMFRQKVACAISPVDCAPIKVTVRLTYSADDLGGSSPTKSHGVQYFDPDHPDSNEDLLKLLNEQSVNTQQRLPFGVCQDPISALQLICSWPNMNEDMIVENEDYTDLHVAAAPYWHTRVRFQPGLDCLLHGHLLTLVNACSSVTPLGMDTSDNDVLINASLGRLTDTSPVADVAQRGVEQLMKTGRDSATDNPLVQQCVKLIFAEVPELRPHESDSNDWSPRKPSASVMENIQGALLESKCCGVNSITSRLCVCLCVMLNSSQGLNSLIQLWRAVIDELRHRWTHLLDLPGMQHITAPDLATCLLHQRLQLLQCCITSKRRRQQQQSSGDGVGNRRDDNTDFMTDDEEGGNDFFDAVEDVDDLERTSLKSQKSRHSSGSSKGKNNDSNSIEATGRTRVLGKEQNLLMRPQVPIYVPETQEPSPMTEEMLAEQMDLIDRFSVDDASASSVLHSRTLMSDMQAFKAANPGCVLADFVRWHSPRDWIDGADDNGDGEPGGHTGRLSTRMADESNLWHQTWNSAKPVPVCRQVRLFNESHQAEKLLYSLSRLTVGELVRLLLPAVFRAAFDQIVTETSDVVDLIGDKLLQGAVKLRHVTRTDSGVDEYRDLLNTIHWLELSTGQYRSLHSLFNHLMQKSAARSEDNTTEVDIGAFVRELMMCADSVAIFGAASSRLGAALLPLFCGSQPNKYGDNRSKPDLKPSCKEYTLRWMVRSPGVESRACPQRMYVKMDQNEFRMHALFSQDVTLI